ncbi:hypothetical protein Tco_0840932 [Tanacetum coccineum]|uniref:Uncharacterized protein n=1 Tax=Tanacetum coccineum TaxID=301880 RepID=A0ABQ5AUY5_9ASTR
MQSAVIWVETPIGENAARCTTKLRKIRDAFRKTHLAIESEKEKDIIKEFASNELTNSINSLDWSSLTYSEFTSSYLQSSHINIRIKLEIARRSKGQQPYEEESHSCKSVHRFPSSENTHKVSPSSSTYEHNKQDLR